MKRMKRMNETQAQNYCYCWVNWFRFVVYGCVYVYLYTMASVWSEYCYYYIKLPQSKCHITTISHTHRHIYRRNRSVHAEEKNICSLQLFAFTWKMITKNINEWCFVVLSCFFLFNLTFRPFCRHQMGAVGEETKKESKNIQRRRLSMSKYLFYAPSQREYREQ